jgi:predicted alpha/beta-fold hydrolase
MNSTSIKLPRFSHLVEVPEFVPHRMAKSGQLQTIIGKMTEPKIELPRAEMVSIQFADGDQTYVEVDHPTHGDIDLAPMVIMMHGLGGSSNSSYLSRLAHKLSTNGWRVVRANHRGAGRHAIHLARGIYHAGSTSDVRVMMNEINRRYPRAPKLMVGFSLSGAILLNLLADLSGAEADHWMLKGGMAVCAPLDLEQSSLAMMKVRNRHLDVFYTRMLKARALSLKKYFPEISYPVLPERLNLRIFDEVFTAPMGGFKSRNEYYELNSPLHKLSALRLPTMILQAADDPVVPANVYRNLKLSPELRIAVENGGGHMGFLSRQRTEHGDRRWMDLAVMRWCSTMLAGI